MTPNRRTAGRLLEAWDAAATAQRAALAALLAAVVAEPPPDRELLDLTAAARRLGRSRSTVHRWINAGALRAVTVNGRRYVNAGDLDTLASGSAVRGRS